MAVNTKTENRYGYTSKEYKKFVHYATRYLVFFSLLYACMYCTRTNLSNVGAVLIEDLDWTKAELGILSSIMFWSYGIGQLVNGRLCEIIGPRKFLFISTVISIACNFVFSFQTSLIIMGIVWGLNGYVQAMAWPAGMTMLSKWWPGDRRGFATGFALACSGFGQVLTTLSVVLSINVFPGLGWRASFIIPALFPAVGLILFMFLVKPYPKQCGLVEYVEENEEKAKKEAELKEIIAKKGKLYPYIYMLKNKEFLVWVFVACLQGLTRYGLVSWIPLYYVEQFNVDVTAGLLQSLALPVGMGIGTLVVPWLTDKYCPNNRLFAAIVSGIIAAASIFGFSLLDPRITWQLWVIEILLFIAGFFIYAVTGSVWAYSTDMGGRVFSGTSAGILNFSQYVGAGIQSMVYGFLLDSIGWSMVFVSVAAFCLLVALIGLVSSIVKSKTKND